MGVPISAIVDVRQHTTVNGQTTSTSYSYDANGDGTLQTTLPATTGGYSARSSAVSNCTDTSTLPCYEIDGHSALYSNAVSRTFYDSQGRAVETRTPLDASHDIVSFIVHNETNDTTFQSQPFRVPHGSNWIDPYGATDESGNAPVGTTSLVDLLGRSLAVKDAIQGSAAEPGSSCPGLSGLWTMCTLASLGTADGNYSIVYKIVKAYDANNHMMVSFTDMLGRQISAQSYSVSGSIQNNITAKVVTQYNAIGNPLSVTRTDLAPQSGQSITSVTASANYNDLGQVISVTDPDRGSHAYTYDADGRIIKDISGSRTLGSSYDLAGRVGCVQDQAPTTDGSGTCSSGSHPLIQNTYDVSQLGISGSTDFPIGQLTKVVATTYYPDSTSSTVTQKLQRDQRGRSVASTLQIAVPTSWNVTTALPTYQQTQTYNDVNQLMTTQTTAGAQPGYTLSQAYDSSTGQQTGLSNNGVGVANLATLSFDLHGQVSDLNFQTTTATALANDHFTYDGDLRPSGTTATWQSGSGSTGTIFSNSRAYDAVGNVISTATTHAAVPGQSNSGGSETQNFCYDELNRLVWSGNSGTLPAPGNGTCGTATGSNSLNGALYSTSYASTHLGQLWQGPLNGRGANQQYLYCDSSHPHQLSGLYPIGTTCANLSGASYSASYDAWGNLTSRTTGSTTAQLSYNLLDELVQWNAGSTNQEWYIYAVGGSRVLKRSTTSSGTTLTVSVFGLEEHVYSASGTNTGNTYYYSLGGRLIGKFDGTTTQFFLTDGLGSVLSTFNAVANTASVLGNQEYGPYGTSRYAKGSMGTNKGFTGQSNDATGLDYYNARYYDPIIGSFISADTVQGNPQGMDPYTYVGGNPETMTDPTGHRIVADDEGMLSATIKPNGDIAVRDITAPIHVTTYYSYGSNTPRYIYDRSFVRSLLDAAKHNYCSENCQTEKELVFFVAIDLVAAAIPVLFEAAVGAEAAALSHQAQADAQQIEDDAQQLAQDDQQAMQDDVAGNANCSFLATTPVATSSGQRAIGNLKPGEKVWAYNPQTKKMELQPILHVWINHDDDLVDLTITTTSSARKGEPAKQTNETIHTNKKHPFLTQEYGFVHVADLHAGIHILKADGTVGAVLSWTLVPGNSVMYNLEVKQDHTFTVGTEQWIVHNTGCTDYSKPNDRHYLGRITKNSPATKENTVIMPGVDVNADVAAINSGKAVKSGNTWIVNGRTYGFHSDRVLFPMSGSGFVELDRLSYSALKTFNKYGFNDRSITELTMANIPESAQLNALELYIAGGKE